jgi:hypothetical protein
LYLTAFSSAMNHDAFRGMNLAEQLPGSDGDLLVRHWLTDSRRQAIVGHARLADDATDREEFEAFSPDLVFLEGGLYWNRKDWRIPPDIAVEFVTRGGIFLVVDVDRNEIAHNYDSYVRDLRFFGAYLDGDPEDGTQIRYVADEVANIDSPYCVLCSLPPNVYDWPKRAFDGIDHVLAAAPVALGPMGSTLLWSAATASVLSQDRFIDQHRVAALGTAARHGRGYAALIAATVSPDVLTESHPNNIRWLCNVATMLQQRATRELRLRGASPATFRPSAVSPYGERTAAELAALPEDKFLEHKQAFAFSAAAKKKDTALSEKILNRISSFWNAEGGTVLVGVEDRTGRIVGLDGDISLFKDLDGLVNHVSSKINQDMMAIAPLVDVKIEMVSEAPVLRIDIPAGNVPVFRQDCFYVRVNNTTRELKGESLQKYLQGRWPRT